MLMKLRLPPELAKPKIEGKKDNWKKCLALNNTFVHCIVMCKEGEKEGIKSSIETRTTTITGL